MFIVSFDCSPSNVCQGPYIQVDGMFWLAHQAVLSQLQGSPGLSEGSESVLNSTQSNVSVCNIQTACTFTVWALNHAAALGQSVCVCDVST